MLRTGHYLAILFTALLTATSGVRAGEAGHSYSADPRSVVLRATIEGQSHPDYALLFGNGRFLVRQLSANEWYEIWLTEAGIQRVLEEAIDGASLFAQPARVPDPDCGGPAPTVSLTADSRTATVSAAGLACIAEPSDLDRRLIRFFGYLDRLTQAMFEPDEVIAWGPFVSDALHVTSLATGTTGGANWPPGVLDPFDGGRLFCYAAAEYLRGAIDGTGGSFNRANVNYQVTYEELLPDSEGWSLCHGRDIAPVPTPLDAAPDPIGYDASPMSLVIRRSYDPELAFPIYPPLSITGEGVRAYGDGTVLEPASLIRSGRWATGADGFWRWRISETGIRRILHDLIDGGALADQPDEYPTPCADCAPPIVEVNAGGLHRRIVSGWDPAGEQGLQQRLRDAINRLDDFARHLMPGELLDWGPYEPGPIWLKSYDAGFGSPGPTPWPVDLPDAASVTSAVLICDAGATEAAATVRGLGDAWGHLDVDGRWWALRYRPAFPEEIAGCGGDDDALVKHAPGRRDLILRFAEVDASRPAPIAGIPIDRMALYGDGTLFLLSGPNPGEVFPSPQRVQLTEAGVQRVLQAIVVDGRILDQPGPKPERTVEPGDSSVSVVDVKVARGHASVTFDWLGTILNGDELPARARRLLSFLRSLRAESFGPGEVVSVKDASYVWAARVLAIPVDPAAYVAPDSWSSRLPHLQTLEDGLVVCGELADRAFLEIGGREVPVLHRDGRAWWMHVRLALPHEYDEATCPRALP